MEQLSAGWLFGHKLNSEHGANTIYWPWLKTVYGFTKGST